MKVCKTGNDVAVDELHEQVAQTVAMYLSVRQLTMRDLEDTVICQLHAAVGTTETARRLGISVRKVQYVLKDRRNIRKGLE